MNRFERLDALRGFAMVWMALFHFAFDLNYYGLIEPRQRFTSDPLWTTQRTIILSLFLLCVGIGQAVAHERGQSPARFWRRWAQVAACAALVSLGSWFMSPRGFIYFGVLHGIAVMLLLLRWGAQLGRWWFAIGLIALALPFIVQHPVFDSRYTNWVGLVTHKPATMDYVPLLPWLGVVGIGFAAGVSMLSERCSWLAVPVPRALRPLASLGRWPLTFYMLHQPLLIGGVQAYNTIAR